MVSHLKILVNVASNYNLDDFKEEISHVIESALQDESAEMILVAISFLRQMGNSSIPYLKRLCRDKNILKAKAAITAIIEIKDDSIPPFILEISKDLSIDSLIRENAIEALSV